MTTKKLVRGLGIGWLLLVAASCVGTEDPTGEDTASGADRSGDDIQQALEALPNAQVIDVDDAGVPTFIAGRLGKVASLAGGTPDVSPLLSQVAKVFRANPDNLKLRTTVSSSASEQHLRFSQTKNGLKVVGGELVIHVKDGLVIGANGKARHDLQTPAADSAKVDANAAMAAATASMKDVSGAVAGGSPELAYRRAGSKLDLVYIVRVTGAKADGTPVVDDVLVNAADSSIAARIPHIHTAKNRELHNNNTGTDLPGPLARTETQGPVADEIVNLNFDRLGDTFDCYKDLFNRDSFDDKGAKLISTVHFDKDFVNAFWDGTQMVYGDGDGDLADNLAKSMDVTAHELTHAVTDLTSSLIYEEQSGGLNESMSDIFGNVCEWYRDVGHDTTKPPNVTTNFFVGEDIWTPKIPGDALRFMNEPTKDGASIDFAPDFQQGIDVHLSSGVPNLAFFLLSQGGTHPRGKTMTQVKGIGILKAAQVFYRANTGIMTPDTNFAAAKVACEQAAQQLGMPAEEVAQVTAAWEAVGVGAVVPPGDVSVLANGASVTTAGARNAQSFFSLDVPAGASNLQFATNGGSGDADLYVKFGTRPTLQSFDCRPFRNGNNESCAIATVQTGTYFVMLNGFAAFNNVKLTGSFKAPSGGSMCAHDPCQVGAALKSDCDPAVTKVCAADGFCCSSSWDSICAGEVTSVGGRACQ